MYVYEKSICSMIQLHSISRNTWMLLSHNEITASCVSVDC